MLCPYCLKDTMIPNEELGSGWSKCSSCGATYSDDPKFLKRKGRKKVK